MPAGSFDRSGSLDTTYWKSIGLQYKKEIEQLAVPALILLNMNQTPITNIWNLDSCYGSVNCVQCSYDRNSHGNNEMWYHVFQKTHSSMNFIYITRNTDICNK